MGKFSLATNLADELGVTYSKAARYVDDVGLDTARATYDEALATGGRTVSDWWKPATAGGILVGGGALAWRQQDIEQAKQIASQQREYSSALESIIASDLEPAVKRELANRLLNSREKSDNNDQNDNALSEVLGDDPSTTIILLIVLIFALKFGLGGES